MHKITLQKTITTFLVGIVAIQPLSFIGHAGNGSAERIQADAAWNHDGFRVERLVYGQNAIGPYSFGDQVVMAQPASACRSTACGIFDVYYMQNGQQRLLEDATSDAFNEDRYLENNEVAVFHRALKADNHYEVVTYDPTLGKETQIIKDVFFDRVQDLDIHLQEDGQIYFHKTMKPIASQIGPYRNATVYKWMNGGQNAVVVGDHWIVRNDTYNGIQDDILLSKMTFKNGYKQLWTIDTKNGFMEAVPGTWTDPDADIYAAHWRTDGSIEFFRNFVHYIYNPKLDEKPVAQGEDFLSWYRDVEDAVQILGDRMVWVDSEDTLYMSDTVETINLGTVLSGEFRLTETDLYYKSLNGDNVYNFETGETTSLPFYVSDISGNVLVGVDTTGSIWYQNQKTGKELELGFGARPVISDENHVYWRGVDGRVYEATISPKVTTQKETLRAIKHIGDDTIYLLSGRTTYAVSNADVYFTWFDSWADVDVVDRVEFFAYKNGGAASFAPGTKVKLSTDRKVYLVGSDGRLHWMTTQTVAYDLFGSTWNQGIINVTEQDMTRMQFGAAILNEADATII